MPEPVTVLASIHYAVSTVNGVRQIVSGWRKSAAPAPEEVQRVQEGMNEVLGQVGQAAVDMALLREENANLIREVAALKLRADIDAKRTLRDGMFFVTDPPAGYGEGPYCTACWAHHVPLKPSHPKSDHAFECPKCQAKFGSQTPHHGDLSGFMPTPGRGPRYIFGPVT